jgi:hypothetical protein
LTVSTCNICGYLVGSAFPEIAREVKENHLSKYPNHVVTFDRDPPARKLKHKEGCRHKDGINFSMVMSGDYDKDCHRCSSTAKCFLR